MKTYPVTGYWPFPAKICIRCGDNNNNQLCQLCDGCHLDDEHAAEIILTADERYTRQINQP